MTDGVCPAMDSVEHAAAHPVAHHAGAESRLVELPYRDDAMLGGCDTRESRVGWGAFWVHIANKAPPSAIIPLFAKRI